MERVKNTFQLIVALIDINIKFYSNAKEKKVNCQIEKAKRVKLMYLVLVFTFQ